MSKRKMKFKKQKPNSHPCFSENVAENMTHLTKTTTIL